MPLLKDAAELTLSTLMSAGSFATMLALAALTQAPEPPVLAAPAAPLEVRFMMSPLAGAMEAAPEAAPEAALEAEEAADIELTEKPRADLSAQKEPLRRPTPEPLRRGAAGVGEARAHRAAPERERAQKETSRCEEPPEEIRQLEADRWEVDKALVDRYTSDLSAAASLAWAAWSTDAAGEVDGFRVKRIRCGSVLHAAGLRNGDVVHSINGRQVTSISEAMRAYARLKRRDSFRLDISRRGEAKRLSYRLS